MEAGSSVLFMTLETLMSRLNKALNENRLERSLQQLTYPKVLIVDEVGYLPLSRIEASLFFRLVVRRYERASLIITSNKSFLDWGEMFNDPLLATAVLDRLWHYAATLNIQAESYRLKENRRAELLGRTSLALEIEQEVPVAAYSPAPGLPAASLSLWVHCQGNTQKSRERQCFDVTLPWQRSGRGAQVGLHRSPILRPALPI